MPRRLFTTLFTLAVLCTITHAQQRVTLRDVNVVVAREIGGGMAAQSIDNEPTILRFVTADFNGDKNEDVAIEISRENPAGRLSTGITTSDPKSETLSPREARVNMRELYGGTVILHGGEGGWRKSVAGKYMIVGAGYMALLVKPGGRGRAALPKTAKGVGIKVMGEGSGDGIIYFDGTKYRYKLTQMGD